MRSSTADSDPLPLRVVTSAQDFAAGVHRVLREVVSVPDVAGVVDLLAQGAQRFGASSACFISFVREADTAATYRMLLACDPRWGTEYLVNGWFETDPWLAYAMRFEEPALASALTPQTEGQRAMVASATTHGFSSVIVAPSPSAAGASRVGVLYVGSDQAGCDRRSPRHRGDGDRLSVPADHREARRTQSAGCGADCQALWVALNKKTLEVRSQRIAGKGLHVQRVCRVR